MKTLTILAKEWFDKTYGNSYFSAKVYADNVLLLSLPFQYGYDNHYIDMAAQALEKAGHITMEHYNNGGSEALWVYCERNGITLLTNKQENCLKRELKY